MDPTTVTADSAIAKPNTSLDNENNNETKPAISVPQTLTERLTSCVTNVTSTRSKSDENNGKDKECENKILVTFKEHTSGAGQKQGVSESKQLESVTVKEELSGQTVQDQHHAQTSAEAKTGYVKEGSKLLHEMLMRGSDFANSIATVVKLERPDTNDTANTLGNPSANGNTGLASPSSSVDSSCSTNVKPESTEDSPSQSSSFQASPSPDATSGDVMPAPAGPVEALKRQERKTRRRGSAWSDEETEFLLEIWARQAELVKDRAGDETATCAAVYRLIAREMVAKNYDKSWEQCKTRIHTLKRAYKITKDEISSGASTITYCRHFDKLGIISLDNPDISPGILAATLEQNRLKLEHECKTRVRMPVKRKLVVGEPPISLQKKSPTPPKPLPSFSTFNHPATSTSATSSVWYPPVGTPPAPNPAAQPATLSALQLSLTSPLNVAAKPYPKALPQPPTYPSSNNSTLQNETQSLTSFVPLTEMNNNGTGHIDKTESNTFRENMSAQDTAFSQSQQWNSFPTPETSKAQIAPSGQGLQGDLERMKLDLEMRKLEVERDKIEMEERQRREERDHEYRMMQLLLFGLGQQNTSQVLLGQGSEVAHAHTTDLSRALENGLVPGGQQTANEKGLSFSEL
ncbi:uncharacterized protein LOC128237895 [Mya arenaria]|uniref:uncharacterized protein LOC128237895 n=1 Tax=Mya arenaria TaxID=6604 RepID=UPI0022E71147|nr:uncharacterized protein LOC128237895 [Mya arenaria]